MSLKCWKLSFFFLENVGRINYEFFIDKLRFGIFGENEKFLERMTEKERA